MQLLGQLDLSSVGYKERLTIRWLMGPPPDHVSCTCWLDATGDPKTSLINEYHAECVLRAIDATNILFLDPRVCGRVLSLRALLREQLAYERIAS